MSIISLPYPTREISNNIPLFLSDIGATALPISIAASGQTITALAGPGKAQSYHVLGGSGTTVTFNDPTTNIVNGIFYKVIIVEEGVSVIIAGQTFTNSGGLIELLRVYYNNSWETITASQSSGSNEGSVLAVPNTLVLRNSQGGGCVFDETAPGSGSNTIKVFNSGLAVPMGQAGPFVSRPVGVNIFCDNGIGLQSDGNIGASISGDALGAEIYSDSGIGLDVNGGTTGVRIVGGTDGIAVTSLNGIGASISGTNGGAEIFCNSGTGNHLNIGFGQVIVANNGNTIFTGTVTAPNLVTNNGSNDFAVRPSSLGPVLSSTSLITQADGDVRYGQRNFSGIAVNAVSSSDTTPIKVASVLLPIGLYYIDSLVSSIHGDGLCTIGLQSNQPLRINVIESYGNDHTAHITNPIGSDNFSSSNRSAAAGTTFNRRVAGIVQITTANTELSITYAQFVGNTTPSITRKRAYITATKLS